MYSKYPEYIDCLWLAIDKHGNVGAFITAGEGPIPCTALACDMDNFLSLEDNVLKQVVVCQPDVIVDVPRPESFAEIASRGLFVYDWGEFTANPIGEIHSYRLVATPKNPLRYTALPQELSEIATSTTLNKHDFGFDKIINPVDSMACEIK